MAVVGAPVAHERGNPNRVRRLAEDPLPSNLASQIDAGWKVALVPDPAAIGFVHQLAQAHMSGIANLSILGGVTLSS